MDAMGGMGGMAGTSMAWALMGSLGMGVDGGRGSWYAWRGRIVLCATLLARKGGGERDIRQ